MPGMGGREVAERISRARPDIKVLYLSGYTDDAILRHGVSHADVAFLQKPYAMGSLAAKVREVLDSR
jgi:two-component system cell cycle sensor histidine kinase/response regulator CckA